MPTVHVRYKYTTEKSSMQIIQSCGVTVSSKTPTESEVIAALRKSHLSYKDIIVLEIK